jgi:hypothetical protein
VTHDEHRHLLHQHRRTCMRLLNSQDCDVTALLLSASMGGELGTAEAVIKNVGHAARLLDVTDCPSTRLYRILETVPA